MDAAGPTQATPKAAGLWARLSSEKMRCLLAGLVLAALPFALFWRVWWPDPQLRQVFDFGDFVEQHYPMRTFVAAELRQGRLPLWDQYTFGGESAAGESLFAPFYPLGLWQALFPSPMPFWVLEIEAIAHLGLAGVLTFLLVRRLTGSAGAGLLAGITFSLGGFLTSYPMLQLIVLESAVWLPAVLWLLEIALARRSLWITALAGLALGVSILAGFPQIVLYAGYLTVSYLIFRAWRLGLRRRFTAAAVLVLGVSALGLSAVQWLPSLEVMLQSARTHMTYEAVAAGFKPAELWGLLRPNPGQWSPLYVGLIPLGLALATPILRRRGETWYWLAVAALALALSLGGNGFLYPLAYRVAPGFSSFRQQERIAYLVVFSLSVLAGYGYAALRQRRWWPRWALPLVLALVCADLFLAHQGVILQDPPPGGYFPTTPSAQYLQQYYEQSGDRMARLSSEGLLPGDGNAGLVYRIRDVTGNGPLHLANYDEFIDKVPGTRWLQMLYARFLLTRRTLDPPLQAVVDEGDRRLYDLAPLGPRPAWITHSYRQAAGASAAIELTADPALDPFQTAVLERAPEHAPEPPTGPESVQVVGFDHQRAIVDVTLSAPGILVLSEIEHPGWTVRVNGRPATGLRAYGVLRAISLPAGRWQVDWHYEPLTVYVGAALSGLTLAALGLAYWRRRRTMHNRQGL